MVAAFAPRLARRSMGARGSLHFSCCERRMRMRGLGRRVPRNSGCLVGIAFEPIVELPQQFLDLLVISPNSCEGFLNAIQAQFGVRFR